MQWFWDGFTWLLIQAAELKAKRDAKKRRK